MIMGSAERCACGSGSQYSKCCGPLHLDLKVAASDPVALMRSRYVAYVLGLSDYLLATWHPATRPAGISPLPPDLKWLGLSVKATHVDGKRATVEFVARSKLAGKANRLHEISRFILENDRWYYVDGEHQNVT